ncbi:MAG: hypothetical protein R6U85_13470 [Salinivirgaceae bacterium]
MRDNKTRAAKILRTLYTNANCDSAGAIRKYQGTSLPGFGIMLPRLIEIAAEFEHSNDLCFELIKKNTREAKIIALLVSLPLDLTASQIKSIEEKASTEELRNYMARFILAPIITAQRIQELQEAVSVSLLSKGIVQAYRKDKTMPPFKVCCNVLKQHIKKSCSPISDAQHLAEAIYAFYTEKADQFKAWLASIPQEQSPLADTINQWIRDFSYQDSR